MKNQSTIVSAPLWKRSVLGLQAIIIGVVGMLLGLSVYGEPYTKDYVLDRNQTACKPGWNPIEIQCSRKFYGVVRECRKWTLFPGAKGSLSEGYVIRLVYMYTIGYPERLPFSSSTLFAICLKAFNLTALDPSPQNGASAKADVPLTDEQWNELSKVYSTLKECTNAAKQQDTVEPWRTSSSDVGRSDTDTDTDTVIVCKYQVKWGDLNNNTAK
jgi:hypothetical protein